MTVLTYDDVIKKSWDLDYYFWLFQDLWRGAFHPPLPPLGYLISKNLRLARVKLFAQRPVFDLCLKQTQKRSMVHNTTHWKPCNINNTGSIFTRILTNWKVKSNRKVTNCEPATLNLCSLIAYNQILC